MKIYLKMNGKSVAKDLQRLVKLIGSVSDGQARVIRAEPPEGSGHRDPDEVDYEISMIVVVEIQPKGGPYRGGTFRFEVSNLYIGLHKITLDT